MVKRRKKVTELERIAYHEAGHVVMAYVLRQKFHFITIDPEKLDENTGGLVRLVHSNKHLETIKFGGFGSWALTEKQIKITLGGEVASGLFVGRKSWKLAEDDVQACLSLTEKQCGDEEEANAYLNWLLLSVRNELNLPDNWVRVRAVAEALMEKKTLNYRKAREIIRTAKDD